jgi:4-diphosphocytidyl-2-C-methyl-D-erythritol kinase
MLTGGTAHGTGRGERLVALPALSGLWFVLATPDFGVSAAEAYETARIGLTGPRSFIRVNCSAIREGDVSALLAGLRNDLEAGVVSARPEVAVVKHALQDAGALAAVMSGSGPTVIGAVETEDKGRSIASRLAGRDWDINVVAPTGTGLRITGSETEAVL